MPKKTQIYISVDVETAGPYPGAYSLLAIGACLVMNPEQGFYAELQPVTTEATDEALSISQLDLAELQETALPPKEAMLRFSQWINGATPVDSELIFVAFNAPFDWMFINYYFQHYLGYNPFGHKALDIKAFYMGLTGASWEETGWQPVARRYLDNRSLSHHALKDAQDQAEIFCKMLAEQEDRGSTNRNLVCVDPPNIH